MITSLLLLVVLLVILLCADGAFSGLRSVVGRTGLLRTGPLVIRALALGGTLGLCASLVLLGVGVGLLGWPPQRAHALQLALETLVLGYGTLATAIALGYALRLVPSVDARSLASILLFGPITLLRPLVVALVAIVAGLRAGDSLVTLLMGLAAATALLLGELLDRLAPSWLHRWR